MTEILKNVALDMFRFPRLGVGMYRVWYRNFFYYKKFFISAILMNFAEPILYIIAFGYGLGFFVGNVDGVPYLLFFAPAILCTTAMQGAVFEATYSSFTKLRVQKTFETIMMSPVSIEEIVAGEIFWAATRSFFGTLAVMIVLALLGLVQTPLAWVALPFLFLLCLTMASISMVMTSFARDYDFFTYYFSLFVTPMSLLSGTFFPLSHFPKWAQIVAQFLPLTHAVIVARALFLDKWENSMWIHIAVLMFICIVFANWAINQTKRRLIY